MSALIRAEKQKICSRLRLQLIHLEVLQYLSQSNQYTDTPAATASYFGMTRGTVSQSLIVLEKKGYIEKTKDQQDKRIIHVQLLPPGQAILKKASQHELFIQAEKLLTQKTAQLEHKHFFLQLLEGLEKARATTNFTVGMENRFQQHKQSSIFSLIETIASLIRAEERKKCTALKIQMVHFQILDYLSRCNRYSDSPAAIANYLGLTRGTVSQTLIVLEKKQFIRKVQDDKDKRVYHTQLLEKGLLTLEKAKPAELFEKASAILNKEKVEEIQVNYCIEVLTALQKANKSYSFGVCKSCKNFSQTNTGFFCELTQEALSENDSEKICQEHVPC